MKRSAAPSSLAKRGKTTTNVQKKKPFGSIPRPLVQYRTGFPKQLKMTHRFFQTYRHTWTAPSANVEWVPFGVNCLYDPFLFVGGAQPLYFDQMAAIYNHYTVMASRMKVTVVCNTNEPFVTGIYIDDDASPLVTALSTICEQPSCVYLTTQRDAEVVRLYKSWDCKSQFGPSPLDNDTLQGNATANPSETQSFIHFVRPVSNGSAATCVYDITVEIQFDTVWHELKVMVGS